jgi:cell division transport system permease protein
MTSPAHTTLSNIKSNLQVFLVSVATITVAFSILGLFLVIFVNLNSFLTTWSKHVQLIVYLEDDISKSQRVDLEQLISTNPEVESMTFISKETAWANFKNTFSTKKSDFIDELNFNPLPSSYNLKFRPSDERFTKIRKFAEIFKEKKGVESVEYGEKWLRAFEQFMLFIRIFLLAVGVLLSLGLVLIVSNTIKLSFYSRQEEIELMLLIGATPNYVRIPFMLEGMLQGLLGGFFALALIKFLQLYIRIQFQGSLESLARGMEFQFISQPIILVMLTSSILIGWLGSVISIRQFLSSNYKT